MSQQVATRTSAAVSADAVWFDHHTHRGRRAASTACTTADVVVGVWSDHDWPSAANAEVLAETDLLWTKPSELTFFAALGLPLIVAPPVGVHEACNRRWAEEWGAALPQGDPAHAAEWLDDWLEDGVLAAAAWAGFQHLPNRGLYRIVEEMARI